MSEPGEFGPPFCGGIGWGADRRPDQADYWRCHNLMTDHDDGASLTHVCAAGHGHGGDHCCALGHRWRQHRPRRRWRQRLRRSRR